MMFRVMPVWYIAAKVARIETGIEIAVMSVLRPSRRNTNSTSVANSPPTTAACSTLATAPEMNVA